MKAAPLLRAWLHRLRHDGISIHPRHRWHGLERLGNGQYALAFDTPAGEFRCCADAVILAMGGGSWPQLGAGGQWTERLCQLGVPVAPLRPANCGFNVAWSEHLRQRFGGEPVKTVAASVVDVDGNEHRRRGEFIITENGVEGGLIYALSAPLRDNIELNPTYGTTLILDLLPDRPLSHVLDEVTRPRGSRSLASHLQSRLGLKGIKTTLLYECLTSVEIANPECLATAIKALPLKLISPRPLAEAISSAGGVGFEALDENLMIRDLPGVFCAGEMIDWEAPTGGYLLTGCLASGHAAGNGALKWLARPDILSSQVMLYAAPPLGSACG